MIRLFVIEDHPLFIAGIRSSFRSSRDGIAVAGSSGNLSDGVKLAAKKEFDLFLLDLHLSGTDPVENVKTLKKIFPKKPIVILTFDSSYVWKCKMAEAGACGYILKDSPRNEIIETLKNAAGGSSKIDVSQKSDNHLEGRFLTPDEQEIVLYLSKGMTLKEITKKTGSSFNMVEKNLRKLRAEYNIKTNTGLITILSNQGLI